MHRCLIIWIVWLALPLGACRSSGIEINVLYNQISGLTVERRVLYQGRAVGLVGAIDYTRDGNYIAKLNIEKDSAGVLTEHTRFYIIEDPDKAGEQAVEIRLSQTGGQLLADGALVSGANSAADLSHKLQREIESGLRAFQQAFEQISRDIQKIPDSKEYRGLKRSMDELAREMVRKEKAARETIKRQWLPRIQRELDELRERLKQLGRENEMAPLDEQVEQLRRI